MCVFSTNIEAGANGHLLLLKSPIPHFYVHSQAEDSPTFFNGGATFICSNALRHYEEGRSIGKLPREKGRGTRQAYCPPFKNLGQSRKKPWQQLMIMSSATARASCPLSMTSIRDAGLWPRVPLYDKAMARGHAPL